MTNPRAPLIASLYVPGDRPERFDKALAAGADQVIVDLEDAVAPERKPYARAAVAEFLAGRADGGAQIAVRPNGPDTPWQRADLEMLAALPRLPALRLPKVEGPGVVDRLPPELLAGGLTCLVETALGVEQAYAIAAHPAVSAVTLGEADLRAQLRITDEAGLDWLRVRLVVAARAAGLDPPQLSIYPWLDDDEGLLASCRHGAGLGLLGRTAIHPRQVPVIRRAFRPAKVELEQAQQVVAALNGSVGAARLGDGRMVDEAMAVEARRTLQLYDLLGDQD
ncbi:MAG TPA: CoA ester lyase [Propionibacteriaceae bacterium]|nr:CoA ester lyase [Propionibacteriaceae bacterium]